MAVECLHVKTRERVSNRVVETWDMLCRNGEVVLCSNKEEVAKEVHDVWTVGGASAQAIDNCPIVTMKPHSEGGPAMAPGCSCQDDGVELLELNAPVSFWLRPAAIEPVPIAESAKSNGA